MLDNYGNEHDQSRYVEDMGITGDILAYVAKAVQRLQQADDEDASGDCEFYLTGMLDVVSKHGYVIGVVRCIDGYWQYIPVKPL